MFIQTVSPTCIIISSPPPLTFTERFAEEEAEVNMYFKPGSAVSNLINAYTVIIDENTINRRALLGFLQMWGYSYTPCLINVFLICFYGTP